VGSALLLNARRFKPAASQRFPSPAQEPPVPLTIAVIRITLIRMTHRFTTIRWALAPLLALLALVAAGFVVEADSATQEPRRVLVVVDTAGARDPGLVSAGEAAVARAERSGADAQLRVTRTPTEQLSVTHYFAAKGFDAIVGAGLDRAIAVDPVAAHYPDTRFSLVGEEGLATAAAAR
jgi:basic membrane lipoprotein Med (substrate-binding protein (PBP1-ABC) superfamily)